MHSICSPFGLVARPITIASGIQKDKHGSLIYFCATSTCAATLAAERFASLTLVVHPLAGPSTIRRLAILEHQEIGSVVNLSAFRVFDSTHTSAARGWIRPNTLLYDNY